MSFNSPKMSSVQVALTHLLAIYIFLTTGGLIAGDAVVNLSGVFNRDQKSIFDLKKPLTLDAGVQEGPLYTLDWHYNLINAFDADRFHPRQIGSLHIKQEDVPLRQFIGDDIDTAKLLSLSTDGPYEGETIRTPFAVDWMCSSIRIQKGDSSAVFELLARLSREELNKVRPLVIPLRSSIYISNKPAKNESNIEYTMSIECRYEYIDEEMILPRYDGKHPVLNLSFSSELRSEGIKTENKLNTLEHIHVGDEFKLLGERSYRITKIVFDDPKMKRRGWIEIEPGSEKLAMGE